MPSDSLKKLHTSLVDNRQGYVEAEKDAETPLLKALFSQMIALKEKAHSDLHESLIKLGEKPDESGSFMATLHKTVIKVRAATTGLKSSLSSFVMGEEQVLDEYNKAIEECASNPTIVATLTKQKESLLSKIAQMKSMEQHKAAK